MCFNHLFNPVYQSVNLLFIAIQFLAQVLLYLSQLHFSFIIFCCQRLDFIGCHLATLCILFLLSLLTATLFFQPSFLYLFR